MPKTDKAKQIVHEAEITRQHARYKIPATIEIEGKRYKVYDWSVSGVGIIGLPDEIYNKKHVTARMIFKFDDFETVIDNLHLEFVSKRPDGVVGARFTEITPQQVAILNQIISAYLAGDIVTEDDIIHAVTRANFMEKKGPSTKIDKKKSYLVLLLLWAFVIFLIMFLLYVMYQRTYVVKSENAYFDANMTIIRAPSPSYIEFAKKFKEGEEVNISQVLMYAHIMYGGVKIVKSPLEGTIYKIMIHNGDFRNVGEPVFAVLEKNYKIFIIANILHKDLKKVNIGDIAKVKLPNGDVFFAKVVRIEFPYNVVEQHSRPLENIYNQARNYDRVTLMPINYKPSTDLISTSAVITIDTLLNKYGWYSFEEENDKNQDEKNKNIVKEKKSEKQVVKEKIEENKTKNKVIILQKDTKKNKPIKEENKTKPKKEVKKEVKKAIKKGYCIIAASSTKPFNDPKSKSFMKKFPNATVEEFNGVYELKLGIYENYVQAKNALKNVRKYYHDAFIIKCKAKE